MQFRQMFRHSQSVSGLHCRPLQYDAYENIIIIIIIIIYIIIEKKRTLIFSLSLS